jgi:hypothetical protein
VSALAILLEMTSTKGAVELEKRWVEQWLAAGPALAAARAEELRSMTAEHALMAAETLLSLAEPPTGQPRWTTSGLVEQQRLFRLGIRERRSIGN